MSSRGLSLVETLVALALVAVLTLSIMPAFTTHTDSNSRTEVRSDAVTAAQQRLETLRFEDIDSMPTGGSPDIELVTIGDRDYEVRTYYCVDFQFCPPASPGSRHLTVQVFHSGYRIYDAETVFTAFR